MPTENKWHCVDLEMRKVHERRKRGRAGRGKKKKNMDKIKKKMWCGTMLRCYMMKFNVHHIMRFKSCNIISFLKTEEFLFGSILLFI